MHIVCVHTCIMYHVSWWCYLFACDNECTKVQSPHKLVEVCWVVSRKEANIAPGFPLHYKCIYCLLLFVLFCYDIKKLLL